jgi:hypothetical protein
MSAKPVFKEIKFDDTTAAAVDAFAKQRDIPALVFPKGGEGKGSDAAALAPLPLPKVVRKAKTAPRPETVVKRLAVELPAYLVKDVGDKAHATGVTVRFIVATALRKAGFRVEDDDLKEDGRRGR